MLLLDFTLPRDVMLNDCLLNRLFRRRSKKISKLRVIGLGAGNSPVTGEFPAQKASYAELFPFDDVIMFRSDTGRSDVWSPCSHANDARFHGNFGSHLLRHRPVCDAARTPCDGLRASIHQVNRKISWSLEAVGFCLDFFDRSAIWQAPRQERYKEVWQISKRYDHSNIQSRGFETSRDLTVRRQSA